MLLHVNDFPCFRCVNLYLSPFTWHESPFTFRQRNKRRTLQRPTAVWRRVIGASHRFRDLLGDAEYCRQNIPERLICPCCFWRNCDVTVFDLSGMMVLSLRADFRRFPMMKEVPHSVTHRRWCGCCAVQRSVLRSVGYYRYVGHKPAAARSAADL